MFALMRTQLTRQIIVYFLTYFIYHLISYGQKFIAKHLFVLEIKRYRTEATDSIKLVGYTKCYI